MTPYYEHAGVTIYHGDCWNVLPEIACASALVTDPPFGINWARSVWNDDSSAYPMLMKRLVSESQRIVTDGWCFVFQAMPNCGRFHEWFADGWRLFGASKNFAQVRPTGVWHSWDPVVFWKNGDGKSKPNCRPESGVVNRDYHVGNVAGVFGNKSGHPGCRGAEKKIVLQGTTRV